MHIYLQQLVAHFDTSIAAGRPSSGDSHHENAHTGTIPVPGQAEAQTIAIFLQFHDQQLSRQVCVPLPDHL